MQELLGRLRALDPEASEGLRVIACFDELMAGGVAAHGLLSAAAALAGTATGMRRGGVTVRVDPRGETLAGAAPADCATAEVTSGAVAWIERDPRHPRANDALILERLALALRLRLDPSLDRVAVQRDLATAVDPARPQAERMDAASRLRLTSGVSYRVTVAPLFATWRRHPEGPEDVVSTPFGPVHVAVILADAEVDGAPLGVGGIATIDDLPRSFRTALIALRLHDDRAAAPVRADDLGGLAELLADLPEHELADRDAAGMSAIMEHSWGPATVDALVRTSTVREAARAAGIHHSTMTTRVETAQGVLGFDPLGGLGRTRLGIAFLRWRLRNSHVLELPAPAAAPATR